MSFKTTDASLRKISNGWILILTIDCLGHIFRKEMYADNPVAPAKLAEAVMLAEWAGMSPETVSMEFSGICKGLMVRE